MNHNFYTMSTMGSIILYVLMVLLSVYFIWMAERTIDNKKRLIYLIIVFLILAVPAAIRYNVGQDQKSYMMLSQTFGQEFGSSWRNYKLAYGRHNVEYSFIILSLLFYKTPIIIFAIYGILTQYYYLRAIWYFRDDISPAMTMFIYMTTFYLRSYNIFRQALAISIVFYAFRFIKERKPIKFIAYVLFATVFHDSALISILLYFVMGDNSFKLSKDFALKVKNILPIIVFFVSEIIYEIVMSSGSLFGRHTAYYEMDEQVGSFLSIGTLLQTVIIMLFICSRNKCIRTSKFEECTSLQTVIWGYVFHFLSFSMGHATRIGLYFTAFLPCALASMHEKNEYVLKSENTIYDWFLIAYGIYKFTNILVTNMFTSLPYSFWLP